MPNRIVHFEIEAADRERAKNFYSQAFGWQLQQMDTRAQARLSGFVERSPQDFARKLSQSARAS